VFAVPRTPSDWRSAENVRYDLRKILRGDGMVATPEPRSAPVNQPSRIELLERRLAEVERRARDPEWLVGQVGDVGDPACVLQSPLNYLV
jgi:hypothetical protein